MDKCLEQFAECEVFPSSVHLRRPKLCPWRGYERLLSMRWGRIAG